jgi:hypothetical protein
VLAFPRDVSPVAVRSGAFRFGMFGLAKARCGGVRRGLISARRLYGASLLGSSESSQGPVGCDVAGRGRASLREAG